MNRCGEFIVKFYQMNKDERHQVMHHLFVMNLTVMILPLVSLVATYGAYIALKHTMTSSSYFVPAPSDVIVYQPEYRIHSVSMTIETFYILFIAYTQHKIRIILGNRVHKIETKKFRILKICSFISLGIYLIGHQIIACVPFTSCKPLNSLGANFYGYGSSFYFITCDIFNAFLSKPSQIASRILTWVVVVSTFFELVIRYYIFTNEDNGAQQWWTMSTIFFLLAAGCSYVKFFMISIDLPNCAIRLSKKIL
ncbi:hypothetical protein TRFO_27535 [Tritrichomonas foetus]|uniref:CWH43-like N-terminal domain-containing protein n=1 Tax=Tritrichomonas foetus TaxID=1144522 RepID=A0A1J4K0K3_9EUKA|nr:hypothetical protein TRFO_27535 [Tritrichomonas foetus]|eukprot:OHT04911.1 hypothetical protein TRFO_27535 [Tritrichomonas foetus]